MLQIKWIFVGATLSDIMENSVVLFLAVVVHVAERQRAAERRCRGRRWRATEQVNPAAEESDCTGEDTETSPDTNDDRTVCVWLQSVWVMVKLWILQLRFLCSLQLDVEIETLTMQLSETCESAAPEQKLHRSLREKNNGNTNMKSFRDCETN